jgi:hypothetical protein
MGRLSAISVARGPVLGLLALAGCVEPYAPALVDANANLLVVDGFINGNGRTRIKLSHSVNVGAATVPTEKGAKLFVVDNVGARYALTELVGGRYQSDSVQLNPARQYQLRLTTAAGVAYASDLVPLKVAPPIDRLSFRRDGSQVLLLLSAHDAQGQSRYYRWGFTETWQFHAAYESKLEYYPPPINDVAGRTTPIYTCWRTEQAGSIRQGSTANQAQDMLLDFPALILSARAERFTIRYSALVSQYTETPEEYAYYELLRKNTEAVGGINDPLPVQLTGNVHRVDGAAEPVLGYVGAHTVQQKRLFINTQDLNLPANWAFASAYPDCILQIGPAGSSNPSVIPIEYFNDPANPPTNPNGTPDFCFYSTPACADCRTRGTTTKPSFW